MDRPETSPEYLAHVSQAFRGALAEVWALVVAGDVGEQLVDTLHFASDLLDIIGEGLDRATFDPAALDAQSQLRERLHALRGHLGPAATAH